MVGHVFAFLISLFIEEWYEVSSRGLLCLDSLNVKHRVFNNVDDLARLLLNNVRGERMRSPGAKPLLIIRDFIMQRTKL